MSFVFTYQWKGVIVPQYVFQALSFKTTWYGKLQITLLWQAFMGKFSLGSITALRGLSRGVFVLRAYTFINDELCRGVIYHSEMKQLREHVRVTTLTLKIKAFYESDELLGVLLVISMHYM